MKTLNISPIKLLQGSHADTAQSGSGCFMNVIAYLNGEPQITDQSDCVCVTIRPITIWLNDYLTDAERHRLLPFIPRAMGTSTNDFSVLLARCKLVVGFAEEMAAHAKVFAHPANYAAHAHAAAAARDAANYAAHAHARDAARAAAKTAAIAAAAAKTAKTAANYAANRQLLIQTAFHFMEAICPPPTDSLEMAVVARAEQLVALATQSN